jgi:hypothetical protein
LTLRTALESLDFGAQGFIARTQLGDLALLLNNQGQ